MCFPTHYGIIVIKEWQDINKQCICSNLLGSQLLFLYYNCSIYCAYLLSSWYWNYLFLKLQSPRLAQIFLSFFDKMQVLGYIFPDAYIFHLSFVYESMLLFVAHT